MSKKIKRGELKVIHGANGVVRVQEDTGDEIKVYTPKEWKAEREKRLATATKGKKKTASNAVKKESSTKPVEDMKEEKDTEATVGSTKPTKTPKGGRKEAQPKARVSKKSTK